MFQKLQKETECEEKKLEASKVTLKEQQQQLEKELSEQKSKLDQVLTQLLVAEERVRVLKKEERWSETLEKTLSQTSTYSPTWRSSKCVRETPSPGLSQKGVGRRTAGRRCPTGSCVRGHQAQRHRALVSVEMGFDPEAVRSFYFPMLPSSRMLPRGRETFRQRGPRRHSKGFL